MDDTYSLSSTTLFNNPALSDVKIKQVYEGQTREYHAHKAVLCLESGYFLNAFTGGFREASESTIELHEDNPEYFEFLLKFIYTGMYDKDEIARLAGSDDSKRILIPIGIYAVADKYDVTQIYEPAAEDVKAILMNAIKDRKDILTTCIKAHYGTEVKADGSMGHLITAVIFEQYNNLLNTENIEKLLLAYPIFAADVALHSQRAKILGEKDRARCSHCTKKIVEIGFIPKDNRFHCPDCGCYQRASECK
ncbi:hypothetical protein AA0119_g8784 [Alternaria tenuissima]|uniref:BTB domain-containing protein n=2 Tax=Alternaria alternata complex TaxID=187734 RepID=A0A4Q4NR32_ALTAL|nr:hypothetical protein AA0115_g2562 [Alternaria tenuissima]RYN67656.1 hypothetical protein AA0118_g1826 [Alternaria tenuissima]RYN81173.1 hypothetical protein AA0117_g2894 [Alternaria alternata]RYN94764.1 hypothetical protein AA0119_g8784 [Alternaria tenuissima]RYO11997.1 hypothetical protein AA0121_g9448 [Alternaria tenuissima]